MGWDPSKIWKFENNNKWVTNFKGQVSKQRPEYTLEREGEKRPDWYSMAQLDPILEYSGWIGFISDFYWVKVWVAVNSTRLNPISTLVSSKDAKIDTFVGDGSHFECLSLVSKIESCTYIESNGKKERKKNWQCYCR